MEKLIKLLNEYGEERWYWDDDLGMCIGWDDNYENREYIDLWVISKKYGFIKWLVENKKINEEEFAWFLYGEDYISRLDEAIIAWLAIADNPIEFLVSILK